LKTDPSLGLSQAEWDLLFDAEDISTMFPDIPRAAIEADILKTKSKEQTVNKILDGQLDLKAVPARATPSSLASSTPAATAASSRPFSAAFPSSPHSAQPSSAVSSPASDLPPLPQRPRPTAMGNLERPPAYSEFSEARVAPESQSRASWAGPVVPNHRAPPLDRGLLDEYDRLDRQMAQLVAANIEVEHALVVHHLDVINGHLQAAQAKYTLLQKRTQKEYKDTLKYKKTTPKSIMAKMKGTFDEKLAKEEAEYVQAKSQEEAARLEVEQLTREQEKLTNQMTYFSTQLQSFRSQQERQGLIIDQIFSSGGGSPEERALDQQLNVFAVERYRHSENKITWEKGREALKTAYDDLLNALHELKSVDTMAAIDAFTRTSPAELVKHSQLANARNYVQSGRLALEEAKRRIPSIPSIQRENIHSLSTFVDLIFDGPLVETVAQNRIHSSLQQLEVTVLNVYNALSWVDSVMASTILQDYFRVEKAYKEASDALKQERTRLISNILAAQM